MDAGAAPEQVTFEEAVSRALRQNPSAQVAAEEVKRAEGLLGEARSGALPSLVGNAMLQRLDGNRYVGGVVQLPMNQQSASAVLTVPLLAPVRWTQWSHGADALDAAARGELDVRRQVAVAAGRAYLAVVAQKRVVDVTVRARETAQAHYAFAHTRFAGGVGNRVDEVRAEQELASDEAQVQVSLTNLARVREALGVLTGTDAPLDAVQEPSFAQGPVSGAALAEADARRVDVQAAAVRAQAADHILRDAWLDYMPLVLGVAQPFYQNPPLSTVPQTGWQAQLILSWTFYDGGLRPSLKKEREAGAAEAHAQWDAALRQAHSDVRLSYEALARNDDALVSAQKAADRGRLALDLATQAYQAGATGNLEVIDAQRAALDAETSAVVAEDAVRQARLDLLAATGHFP